jgi:hypothetical protein
MLRLLLTLLILSAVLPLTACTSGGRQLEQVTPLPNQPPAKTQVTEAVTVQTIPSSTPSPTATLPAAVVSATPTPWQTDLPEGNARVVALATDVALRPTPRQPITFDSFPVAINFKEFYDGYDMRRGLILSDKLVSLDGQSVVMEGYMAPPLKANLDFFVLTRIRLAICPFCSSDADWPNDIALIYAPENKIVSPTQLPVRVTGHMEVGSSLDYESGMVSLVRIYAEKVETLQ